MSLFLGSILEKKCRRIKLLSKRGPYAFPVEPADHNVSVSPAPQTFPLTSKRISEKKTQNGQPQTMSSAPPVGESVSVNPAPTSQNKKREIALTAPTPSAGKAQDQKKPQVPDGWSIQVHVTKSPSTARQLAAELRRLGYTVSVNRLTKNGENIVSFARRNISPRRGPACGCTFST